MCSNYPPISYVVIQSFHYYFLVNNASVELLKILFGEGGAYYVLLHASICLYNATILKIINFAR